MGDFNHDGGIDGRDFALWYAHTDKAAADAYLASLGLDAGTLAAARVPEAGTVGVLAPAVLLLARRRRGAPASRVRYGRR